MRNRCRIKEILVLLLLAAAGLLCMALLRPEQPEAVPAIQTSGSGNGVNLEVYSSSKAQKITLWEEKNTLYALLPGWYREKRVIASADDPEAVFQVDGHTVKGSGFVHLAPGHHEIILPGEQTPRPLEVLRGSRLPVLFLSTESENMEYIQLEKGNRENGTYSLVGDRGQLLAEGTMNLRGRGNGSWIASPKKPYLLHLDEKQSLLGMEEARKWVLTPNGRDSTQLRNEIALDLARQAGMNFTPDSRYADLYVNGEYQGIYQICEKVEVRPGRVDIRNLQKEIEELNPDVDFDGLKQLLRGYWGEAGTGIFFEYPNVPEDVTGGYLMELELPERFDQEKRGFISQKMQHVVVHNPARIALSQMEYIRDQYQKMENAVWSPDGVDPVSGIHYSQLLDMTSFAQKILVEEIVENYDAVKTSQFLYKPSDAQSPLIYAGPAWDYDFSMAPLVSQMGEGAISISDPCRFHIPQTGENLYSMLMQHEDFMNLVYQQFYAVFLPAIRGQVDSGIRQMAEQLLPSVQMDAIRWALWPEAETPEQRAELYLGDVDRIRTFLQQRADWLCSQWPQPEQ